MSEMPECQGWTASFCDVAELAPAEIKRQALIDHVHTVARRLAVQRGLNVTMDQIAEAAGTSRSTIFRLFPNRERLLGDAFMAGIHEFSRDLPSFGGDVDRWLLDTCEVAHRRNSAFGPGYWELTSRTDLPPELAAAERRRAAARREAMRGIARTLWTQTGREADAPRQLVEVVVAHLSAHYTAAVVADAGADWRTAARLANDAIRAALDHASA